MASKKHDSAETSCKTKSGRKRRTWNKERTIRVLEVAEVWDRIILQIQSTLSHSYNRKASCFSGTENNEAQTKSKITFILISVSKLSFINIFLKLDEADKPKPCAFFSWQLLRHWNPGKRDQLTKNLCNIWMATAPSSGLVWRFPLSLLTLTFSMETL